MQSCYNGRQHPQPKQYYHAAYAQPNPTAIVLYVDQNSLFLLFLRQADPAAALQAIVCMCLAAAHGANNARTSVGMLAIMLAVHNTGAVAETVELPWAWRIMAAVGMTLGTLLLGFRLTPVSGEAANLAASKVHAGGKGSCG